MQLRTPLAKARGLGSAGQGLHHWKMQRLSSIASAFLLLWFVTSAVGLAGAGYEETRAWLQSPVAASLMVMLIVSVFYHAMLGIQVVVEDYVHHEGAKLATLTLMVLVTAGLAVICVMAVLKVYVGR